MSGNFVELRLAAVLDPGELLAHLSTNDPIGAWENEGTLCIYWPEDAWSPRILEDLDCALQRLGVTRDKADIRIQTIADQDWNEIWTRSIHPIRIGKRVLIRQSWNPVDIPPGIVELVIDPKRAFGSGYHATTQLLVEWISEEVRGDDRVLDIGTGSGILAMTALRCGAAHAVGVDNDDAAIECAQENALLNGFGAELELRIGSDQQLGGGLFDLIVANIDRKTLLACAGRLRENLVSGGRVLLSGLQAEDCGDLANALADAGGQVIEERRRDEWIAVKVRFS